MVNDLEKAMKQVAFISAMVYELIPVRDGKISVDDAIKFNRFWVDFTRNAEPKRENQNLNRILLSIACLISLANLCILIYRALN